MKDNGTKIAFFILLSELHAAWLLLSGVVSLIRTCFPSAWKTHIFAMDGDFTHK